MEEKLDKLRQLGCDADGAIARFMDDRAVFLECFACTLDDPTLGQLGEALSKKDCEAAFHCAHKLKGVYANMGLTPLLDECTAIVEPLRCGAYSDELLTRYNKMTELMQKLKQI